MIQERREKRTTSYEKLLSATHQTTHTRTRAKNTYISRPVTSRLREKFVECVLEANFWSGKQLEEKTSERRRFTRRVVTPPSSSSSRKCADSAHPPYRLALFTSSFTSSSSSSWKKKQSRRRLKSSPSSSSFKDDDGCGFLDDDDSGVRCIALPDDDDDDDDEKVDAFLSKTRDSEEEEEEEEGPGTFAILTRRKKEDEWTRVHVQSTKALKRDVRLSVTTMLKARRRRTSTTTSDDETDERSRSRFVVAYKTLPIGARKKMFKDAETYFEERFVSSSSTVVAGRGEDDDGEDDGSRGVDDDVKNRKSSGTSTTAQTLLFSSEHVEQLEAFGFVVLDDVVPEQAVRQMYEQCESLADKLFPVNQEGRDDDLASIKIDIENPTASPLNVAGTFLWSLPRKLCEISSSSSISPPKCALAARERAENTAYPKFAQLAKYDKQGARYDPHVDYDPNNADGPEGSRICERNLTAILYFNLGYETEAEGCLRVFLNQKQEEQEEEQEEDKEAKERETTTTTTRKVSRHPTASRSSRPLRFAQDFARRHALV